MLVPQNHDTLTCARNVARLHANGQVDRCSITFKGKVIVSRSRDLERDDARALLTRGITVLNRSHTVVQEEWAVDNSPSHWAQIKIVNPSDREHGGAAGDAKTTGSTRGPD